MFVSIVEQKERLTVPIEGLDEKRAEYEREKKEARAGVLLWGSGPFLFLFYCRSGSYNATAPTSGTCNGGVIEGLASSLHLAAGPCFC